MQRGCMPWARCSRRALAWRTSGPPWSSASAAVACPTTCLRALLLRTSKVATNHQRLCPLSNQCAARATLLMHTCSSCTRVNAATSERMYARKSCHALVCFVSGLRCTSEPCLQASRHSGHAAWLPRLYQDPPARQSRRLLHARHEAVALTAVAVSLCTVRDSQRTASPGAGAGRGQAERQAGQRACRAPTGLPGPVAEHGELWL